MFSHRLCFVDVYVLNHAVVVFNVCSIISYCSFIIFRCVACIMCFLSGHCKATFGNKSKFSQIGFDMFRAYLDTNGLFTKMSSL